jgi:hypothetical protein
MRKRCTSKQRHDYPRYGGRGISICKRWDSFAAFAADMGPHPGKGWSIERKRNNGNYRRSNCEWATRSTQQRNKRTTKLTAEKVAQIRALWWNQNVSYAVLVKQFHVAKSYIRKVVHGRAWA